MSVWEITYILDREPNEIRHLKVFADNPLQAVGNAMSLIQIIEKTTAYIIKDVNQQKK
jgi:hypothetical protein